MDDAQALQLEAQACFALTVAARAVVAVYKPILEPLGLTHPQYLVMLALWQGEPLRVRELSERLQLESATLSPLLKRLENAGFIERRRDERDERALAVVLTDQGRALRSQAIGVPSAVARRLNMSLEELNQVRISVARLIETAQAASEPELS